MSITDFLAKITGQADRLENAVAKLESDHQAVIAAKDQEIADLNALLSKSPSSEALAAKDTEIADLTKRAEVAEAAASPEKINAEVARIVAAQGHEPLETTTSPEAATDVSALILAEKDPVKRTELYRKHKASLKSSYRK